jgi:aerobic-type carbon monoxide dehydrogenase small subunit (CoxS/CutS family)
MEEVLRFTLNGRLVELAVEPGRKLLWVLRDDLGKTGAKYGCGQGQCGSCTVLVDGRAVRACVTTVGSVAGKQVLTIEGLARDGALHPLQRAFVEHGALQCGYCTPGMILGAHALLARNPDPSPEEVVAGMEGHLCRCGAHVRIVRAVRDAAAELRREESR